MNKQEVIESLEKKREQAFENIEYYRDKEKEKYEKMNRARVDSYTLAIQLVEQIEETKQDKPVVKPFVSDWYERSKWHLEENIFDITVDIYKEGARTDFKKWFDDVSNKPVETLIKMKLFGYTVEQPKRWVVKFNEEETDYYFMGWSEIYKTADNPFVPNGYKKKNKDCVFKFDDRAKAEAVATLIDGSAEEI